MQSRLNDIFHMKPVNDIVGSVSNFRSTFQGLLRVLKSLGANIEESGCVFALFFRKLPVSTQKSLNRAAKLDVWDLENFRTAINEEIKFLAVLQDKIFRGNSSFFKIYYISYCCLYRWH